MLSNVAEQGVSEQCIWLAETFADAVASALSDCSQESHLQAGVRRCGCVAVRVHINFIGLLLESTSHACSARGCLLTSTNSCGAIVVVQRFLYVSLFLIHVPNLDLISDPLLRDISMELLLIAL